MLLYESQFCMIACSHRMLWGTDPGTMLCPVCTASSVRALLLQAKAPHDGLEGTPATLKTRLGCLT